MGELNTAFLFDAFNIYYNQGMEAKKQGNLRLAKKKLLSASETLLKLAAASAGELKRARTERAERLYELAVKMDDSVSVKTDAAVKRPGSGTAEKGDRTSGAEEEQDKDLTKWHSEKRPNVRFEDVAGLDEVKEAVNSRIILPRLHPEVFKRFKRKPGGGILMYGLPGTGKTFIARATAGEVGASFYSVKCSDVLSKWFGDAEQNVRNLFAEARRAEAAVIFFDEFEAIASSRDNNDPAMQRLIPELLAQMDGFEKSEDMLLLIAATNKPWLIDSAFMRPGRFSERIYVPLPDREARRYMIERFYRDLPLGEDADIEKLIERTEGYSGADISELCEQSKSGPILRAIESGKYDYEFITASDIEDALQSVRPSVSEADAAMLNRFRSGAL